MGISVYTHYNGSLRKSKIFSRFRHKSLKDVEEYILDMRNNQEIPQKDVDYYNSFQFVIVNKLNNKDLKGTILKVI